MVASHYVSIIAENNSEQSQRVAYLPDMRLCDYVKQVLLPQVPYLRRDETGMSMLNTIYYYNGAQVKIRVFTYENRLKKLGEVVPCHGVLYVAAAKNVAEYRSLVGNATCANVHHPCCICLEKNSNFVLQGCDHCFHDSCLAPWTNKSCPMCRVPISALDQERLDVAILGAACDGRLSIKNPLVTRILMQSNNFYV